MFVCYVVCDDLSNRFVIIEHVFLYQVCATFDATFHLPVFQIVNFAHDDRSKMQTILLMLSNTPFRTRCLRRDINN